MNIQAGEIPSPENESVSLPVGRIELTEKHRGSCATEAAHRLTPTSQDRPAAQTLFVLQQALRWLRREVEITARMMVNNSLVVVSTTQITLGVALKNHFTGSELLRTYLIGWVLAFLYTYTFDLGNQAQGRIEDTHNKPWRPVPAGLVTPQGLRARYIVANVLYTYFGWRFGVLEWVLFWQLSMIVMNALQGRWYFIGKQITMQTGLVAMYATAWGAVEPLNALMWRWMFFAGVLFVFPLIMEDLRDIKGDKIIRRRTPITLFGHWPVRIWSATWMFALPFIQHFALYAPSGASGHRIALCDCLVFSACWLIAYRLLRYRTPKQDAITYALFYVTFLLALTTLSILYF
ncbi:UbiA family prenyltransferase [Nocardia brasiliensis]|uniref:UbiA family prenyltransferase n=1 Tax=Nocardia brasiliensis TaxID=37326 RepID=UPI0024576093|nr:UbiA family prenyltransferase [Nocardia brasiliensis]